MANPRPKRASTPILTEFERGVLPAYRGLARRLADGTLRPSERIRFDWTIGVLRLREKGLSLRAIAVELHTTEDSLKKFTARGVFRTIAQFLREQEAISDARFQGAPPREERRCWGEFAPDALDYFDAAFEKDASGDFVDLNRAERAAYRVAKSCGWTEPEPAPSRPVRLSAGIVQAQMRAIAESDAAITRRIATLNGSCTRDG